MRLTLRTSLIQMLAIVVSSAVLCSTTSAANDPILEKTWGEALGLAKDWKLGDVKLQTDASDDVYVTPALSVVVGDKFLSKVKSAPNTHDALLFALLHELWHVHQIMSDRSVYDAPAQRRILECAADARAAYTLTLKKHEVLSPEAPFEKGESIAQELAAIPSIPLQFIVLTDATAMSLQHLGTSKRRFAALVGVLQGLSADSARLPTTSSAGTYGRLQRQSSTLWSIFPRVGISDQEKMNDLCSYIVGSGAEKDVRVTFLTSEILQQNGQRVYAAVQKIDNLADWPIRYSYLTVDGVIDKDGSDEDLSKLTTIRRAFVNVSARGSAKFQSINFAPAIDTTKFKYMPFYSLGRLDRVDQIGASEPPASCFDDIPATVASKLDLSTKLAIRIGQSAFGKFEGVRGVENKLISSEYAKVYQYSFDPPGKESGQIHIMSMEGMTYASLDLYEGDDKVEALEIIDRIASYAKQACPASEDPSFPLFSRNAGNHSLDFRRFTTGSSASVVLALPEPDDPGYTPIRVSWLIHRNVIEP